MKNKGVLIIYAGGTIGMSKIATDNDTLVNKDEVIKNIIKEVNLNDNDRVMMLSRIIDSSQLNYHTFNEISTILKTEYNNYNGFLIISGTDTMAYLQSLLKWQIIGLEKPIILTGAISSYDKDNNEGTDNINYALMQINIFKNQGIVAIAMNNRLLKKPTSKINSISKKPYQEIDNSALEKYRENINKKTIGIFFNLISDLKFEIIYLNPFLYIAESESIADGLLIMAYGQGTFKEDPLLRNRIKYYQDKSKPIIVLSQCKKNNLNVRQYNAGSFLEGYSVEYFSGSCLEEGLAYLTYIINNNILIS